MSDRMSRYRRHAPHGRHRGGDIDVHAVRPELTAGCVLAEKYLLIEKVGAGGMGEVWSAEHVTLHMVVAVKVLLPHSLHVAEVVARFKREALLLARTRSEYVPRALDFATDAIFGPILVTELVEGESLSDLLKVPLSVENVIELGIALATGISDLHLSHVVHRDLKPSNVILTTSADGRRRAVILDLGVSRWVNEERELDEGSEISAITVGDNVVGTLEYMPPEQLLRCGGVTAAADIYALGAILARAVLGRHIFGVIQDRVELVKTKLTTDAPALETGRNDRAADGLVAVVRRALERDTANRYASAEHLRQDLEALRTPLLPTCPSGTGSMTDPVPPRETVPAPEPVRTISPARALSTRDCARPLRGRLLTAAMLVLLLLGVAVCSRQPKTSHAAPDTAAVAPP
jgi:eukaryotic-like serine/threonine-protein kinase